jgi:hypothetical protein
VDGGSKADASKGEGRPGGTIPAVSGLPLAPSGSPRSIPEARPTPLQRHYIELSMVALICGAIAISAVEFGAALTSPLVRASVLVGGGFLAVTMADALLRIWRAAWAWMPVDRGKGLFRLTWVAAIVALYAVLVLAIWAVLSA